MAMDSMVAIYPWSILAILQKAQNQRMTIIVFIQAALATLMIKDDHHHGMCK